MASLEYPINLIWPSYHYEVVGETPIVADKGQTTAKWTLVGKKCFRYGNNSNLHIFTVKIRCTKKITVQTTKKHINCTNQSLQESCSKPARMFLVEQLNGGTHR